MRAAQAAQLVVCFASFVPLLALLLAPTAAEPGQRRAQCALGGRASGARGLRLLVRLKARSALARGAALAARRRDCAQNNASVAAYWRDRCALIRIVAKRCDEQASRPGSASGRICANRRKEEQQQQQQTAPAASGNNAAALAAGWICTTQTHANKSRLSL